MDPKHLTELPFVYQVIAGLGLFFGTFMLAIGGWLWKAIKPKLPGSIAQSMTTSTTVETPIASAQILDSKVFERLSHAIERSIQVAVDDGEDVERALDRNYKRLGDLVDEVTRGNEILVRIERNLKDRIVM